MFPFPPPPPSPPQPLLPPPSPPLSPSHKRHHEDDVELREIKRRMLGLRFGEAETLPAAVDVAPLAFPAAVGSGADAGVGGMGMEAANTMPAEEANVAPMDSDDSGDEAEATEAMGAAAPTTGNSNAYTSSNSNSNLGGISRIGDDDPRAVMLNVLYKRRPPRDKVEAKIENLIRSSLLRANPSGGHPPPLPGPLSLCSMPWQEVEAKQRNDGGSVMDTSAEDEDEEEGGMAL